MELVYLWVEKYKNIHEQGFNFSPRFECKYENNELTICDKKKKECKDNNYIENFFGDNINVTAIVGKNGSGKSNIFEASISNFMLNYMRPIGENYKVLTFFYNEEDEKIYYKALNSSLSNLNGESLLEINTLGKYIIKPDKLPFTFHYNYSLDWMRNDDENSLDFDKLYHKTDNYKTPILLQPNKSNNKISIANIDYIATRDILYFTIQNGIKFDFIEEFFVPISCELTYFISDISKQDDNIFFQKLEEQAIKSWDIEHFRFEAYCYILRKTIDKGEKDKFSFIKDAEFKKKLMDNEWDKNFDNLIEIIKNHSFDDLYDNRLEYQIRKIKDTFKFLEYIKDFTTESMEKDLIKGKKNIKDNKDILLHLPPYVQVEFFDKDDVSFYSLSYGQKFIIKFIYSLLAHLKNLESHPEYRNINILLDELEQGLHPEWQKKFLDLLIQVLKEQKDFKFNVICATHSPFILSDIPSSNIYFIKDGKKDIGVKQQTFGANIHTLLSDSFFMDDGLMGEFAKDKINDVYNFIVHHKTDKIKSKEDAQAIIDIVGEPLIQRELQQLFDKKFELTNMSIDDEISLLERKLKALKEIKNDTN